jgi:DNA-binding PadR family transcriptional regulator
MQPAHMRELTELDFCVLGVVWRSGPLTAYEVRKEFRRSPTASWSSSSGSIYPSIRRLLATGLATATSAEDARGKQLVSITPAGLNRLRQWIVELRPELGAVSPDPIRTRAQFLTSVSAEDRVQFFEAARRVTMESLRVMEGAAEANAGDSSQFLEQLGVVGVILELKARLEWLDAICEMLSEGQSPQR